MSAAAAIDGADVAGAKEWRLVALNPEYTRDDGYRWPTDLTLPRSSRV
jgi:hypothetical protein